MVEQKVEWQQQHELSSSNEKERMLIGLFLFWDVGWKYGMYGFIYLYIFLLIVSLFNLFFLVLNPFIYLNFGLDSCFSFSTISVFRFFLFWLFSNFSISLDFVKSEV